VFTGIVRDRGRVTSFEDGRLVVETEIVSAKGDSVAVDGVCLTVVDGTPKTLAFDVVPETLARSTLGGLQPDDEVNLEPALRAGEPLGGHVVQGHVDGVGSVRSLEREGEDTRLWVDAPEDLLRYCVEKGSIGVAGVSLTIAGLDARGFAVALVPHTLAVTTLGGLSVGDRVNVEVDLLAKYVEKLVQKG
jgi:riboflavin synthase alpha subunit